MKYLKENGTYILLFLTATLLVYKLAGGGEHPLTGKMAPDFQLSGIDGREISLIDHRGKEVVVLDFWASWCPPCREGLPVVDHIAREYAGKPVAVYAINIRESKELVSEFAKAHNLTLPILLDAIGIVSDDYQVEGIPQTVIIDRNGRINTIHTGLSMWNFHDTLSADIEATLMAGDAAKP